MIPFNCLICASASRWSALRHAVYATDLHRPNISPALAVNTVPKSLTTVLKESGAHYATSRAHGEGVGSQLPSCVDAATAYIVFGPGASESCASEGFDRPPGTSDGGKSAGSGDSSQEMHSD
jgi:hypothetical protein